jgi:NADH dehydrogenase
MVVGVDERGLDVQDKDGTHRRIDAVTKVWAAGVEASPLGKTLAEQSGASLDKAGRIGVNPDLTLPGYPEVFVVGDMIDLDHLPGLAQVAIQGGKYAARTIAQRLQGRDPQQPFHYVDKGSLATISRFSAVANIRGVKLTGFLAWLVWLGVHLVYLTGFKNQVTALVHWAVTFVGNERSQRTATEQQIFARQALQRLEKGTREFVSDPGDPDRRRAELEARAAEETRLTDQRERGTQAD